MGLLETAFDERSFACNKHEFAADLSAYLAGRSGIANLYGFYPGRKGVSRSGRRPQSVFWVISEGDDFRGYGGVSCHGDQTGQ